MIFNIVSIKYIKILIMSYIFLLYLLYSHSTISNIKGRNSMPFQLNNFKHINFHTIIL
jgi:hypothetical protein